MSMEIQKLGKPFENISHGLLVYNIKLLESGINNPFIILNDRTRVIFEALTKKTHWLAKIEEELLKFKRKIDDITNVEGLYVRLREAHSRTPFGYIVELLVIIPHANRKLELQIYDFFGELLQSSQPLLFDLHLSKLKGRNPKEIMPEGFWRYEC